MNQPLDQIKNSIILLVVSVDRHHYIGTVTSNQDSKVLEEPNKQPLNFKSGHLGSMVNFSILSGDNSNREPTVSRVSYSLVSSPTLPDGGRLVHWPPAAGRGHTGLTRGSSSRVFGVFLFIEPGRTGTWKAHWRCVSPPSWCKTGTRTGT